MDEHLEKVLGEIKKRVLVLDGENPVISIQDAIRLAERNKLIYRWAQNGDYYQLRWSEEHSPIVVHSNEVCAQVYKRILLLVPVDTSISESKPAEHETNTNKEAAVQAKKPPKAGGGRSKAKKNLKPS